MKTKNMETTWMESISKVMGLHLRGIHRDIQLLLQQFPCDLFFAINIELRFHGNKLVSYILSLIFLNENHKEYVL